VTHSINEILEFESLDLTPFQIRGAKSGINNAQSTGPVYVGGSYNPHTSSISADGSFSQDSSIVTNLTISTDLLKVMDSLIADSLTFSVKKIDDSTSFEINQNAGFAGTVPIQFNLTQREYIVEPDSANITSHGTAIFIKNSVDVTGVGTAWLSQLGQGDFIRQDSSQQFYRIATIVDNDHLQLSTQYLGDSVTNAYTAKLWYVGDEKIQYAKNNITFDNQGGRWKYDKTTASDVTTSLSFLPLTADNTDGITMAFTHALSPSAPDIMDIATTSNTVLSRSTQYDTFQYSLPVVPDPSTTFQLWINDVKKDQFPNGNQDYVINYSQNPVFTPPPPPAQRKVANLMFLKGTSNSPSSLLTQNGQIRVTDSSSNAVTGIMPGSETLLIDSTPQVPYLDYILEPNSGTIEAITSVINESIVQYVGVNYNSFVDYGFSVLLNGEPQTISFPPKPTDDILFQTTTGRLKPQKQDHPGPGDVYEVHYMVGTTPIQNETLIGSVGQANLQTRFYPIQQGSVLLLKGGSFLTENEDFFISYLTGQVILAAPLTSANSIVANYTPLSKQVNQMTYQDGTSFCTTLDSRLIVKNINFQFSILNTALSVETIFVLRIYNETRDEQYDLTGLLAVGGIIALQPTATNTAIGLSLSDVVVIDYKFPSLKVEYTPVVVNYLNIVSGTKSFYFENKDLRTSITVFASLGLQFPDSATQFFFIIQNVVFDSIGTKITITTTFPEDITNPTISISDAPVVFLPLGHTANPLVSGSTVLSFSGVDIANKFRPETLIKIGLDYYQVSSATSDRTSTTVYLNSQAIKDYTDGDLESINYSNVPVYVEGETVITPANPATSLSNQPGFIMQNNNDAVVPVIVDSSALTIDGTTFLFSSNLTLGDMSSAIDGSHISALAVTTYVGQLGHNWQSNKLIPQSTSVFRDSSTILQVSDALSFDGNDTTNFTIGADGNITLTKPLQKTDRYNLDYMGLRFLGNSQVEYSVKYFTTLPAGSKVSASFQFDNLDQFYIQVLSEKDFLQTVTEPRMQNEATQLNGNVGQGGVVVGDSGGSNTDGGIAGDEYRRQDAAIECTIFKNIYDFFQNRLVSFGDEMEAAMGLQLFNNDGLFSEEQQTAAFKAVNRIFPQADYTNMEPMRVNPLTGYFIAQGGLFTHGHPGVQSLGGTQWTQEFDTTTSNFIGRMDSTRRYQITHIVSDSSVSINIPFQENTTANFNTGDLYTASAAFPIYDDDGYIGPKIIGTKNSGFGLTDGDDFSCNLGGYTFHDLPIPFNLFFPLSGLSADNVAQQLNANIPGLQASVENALDSSTTFGFRSTIVLRTSSSNILSIQSGSAVPKLGFGLSTSIGNRNPADHTSELALDTTEAIYVGTELSLLNSMISQPNKLDRVTFAAALGNAVDFELALVNQEIPRLNAEINALGIITDESSFPPFSDSSTALTKAIDFLAGTEAAQVYDASLIPTWQDRTTAARWSLDLDNTSQNFTGVLGQTQLSLTVPGNGDIWFLDATSSVTIDTTSYQGPLVFFQDTSEQVQGSWTGWNPSVGNAYSSDNTVIFSVHNDPVIRIDRTTAFTTASYITDATSLTLSWFIGITPFSLYLPYDSTTTLSDIAAPINGTPGFIASVLGPPSDKASAFKIASGGINLTAFLYQGLRDCRVDYQTISERLITPRIAQTVDRDSTLSARISYLPIREGQIKADIENEQILRTFTGDPSDLYAWANNRFNRRQGCYARLNQIQQQILSNQSALNINRIFL
jgi:hypothetical protein